MSTLLARNADILITMDDETREFARAGGEVTNCPCLKVRPASGMAPVMNYLAAGVRVGLGADGSAAPALDCRSTTEKRVDDGQVTTVDMDPVIEEHNRFSRELASLQLTRSS